MKSYMTLNIEGKEAYEDAVRKMTKGLSFMFYGQSFKITMVDKYFTETGDINSVVQLRQI